MREEGFGQGGSAGRAAAIVVAALVAIVAWAGAARADAAVGLDPAFGSGGLTMTPPGAVPTRSEDIGLGIGPDGSALVTSLQDGGLAVRFDAGGAADVEFGDRGVVSPAALVPPQLDFSVTATALDSQGRTLVFGESIDYGHTYAEGVAGVTSGSSAMVIRLDADGRLDPTFGEGKGYVVGSFGIHSHLPVDFPTFGIMAGTVDSRDRPVLIADAKAAASGCYAHGGIGPEPVDVVRLTESGALDPTFGRNGLSPIKGSGVFADPVLGLDQDDRPVAAVGRLGSYKGECGTGRFLYRLRADGSRMGSFGADGFRAFKRLQLALVEPSGALILDRRHGQTIGLVRILPDGSRDKTFGHGGLTELHLPATVGPELAPVGVDAQGRILLAGAAGSPASKATGGGSPASLVVARLLPDGRPDPTFGSKGLLYAAIPGPVEVTATRAALDPQGRLLVAAAVTRPGAGGPGLLLARFLLE